MKTQARPAFRPVSDSALLRGLAAGAALLGAASASPVLPAAALAVLGPACVTVNVNLPEGEVQKATDDYVRDLYRAREKGRNSTPGAGPTAAPAKTSSARSLSDLLVAPAYADSSVSFKLDSAKALQIRDKLAVHLDDLIAQKKSGMIGETNDGMVTLHSEAKLTKLQEKRLAPVQKLVDDENTLRKELYDEVIRSNGLSRGNRKDIERSFSRSFQAESPSGTWVQDADGRWSQKP